MSLILITGTSTSGRSTVAKELVKRGYKAYDTEDNCIIKRDLKLARAPAMRYWPTAGVAFSKK